MEDNFTAREVAVLVEDLRSEFRTVAEVVLPLREDMAEVKERLGKVEDAVSVLQLVVKDVCGRLTGVEGRLTGVEEGLTGVEGRLTRVEDAVISSIPPLSKRVTRIETKLGF